MFKGQFQHRVVRVLRRVVVVVNGVPNVLGVVVAFPHRAAQGVPGGLRGDREGARSIPSGYFSYPRLSNLHLRAVPQASRKVQVRVLRVPHGDERPERLVHVVQGKQREILLCSARQEVVIHEHHAHLVHGKRGVYLAPHPKGAEGVRKRAEVRGIRVANQHGVDFMRNLRERAQRIHRHAVVPSAIKKDQPAVHREQVTQRVLAWTFAVRAGVKEGGGVNTRRVKYMKE